MESETESTMTKIVSTLTAYPVVLLAAVGILFIIILAMYFGVLTGKETMKKTKSEAAATEDELDDLVNSIHEKQKD